MRRTFAPGRRLVDGALLKLRAKNPGYVDDSWWIATAPPTAATDLDTASLTRLRNPRRSFLADPVALVGATDEYLVEEYSFATRRGIISHLRFDEHGKASLRSGIIDAPYHLSFPTTFRHDGRTWIVPEAAASGATHVWELDAEAGATRYAGQIIDVPVRDAVIFEHGGRWYMLGTGALPEWHLVLYVADDPLAQWEQVAIDNRSAYVRPGGTLVPPAPGAAPGTWLVPMQGSSRGYGSELGLCELRLDPAPVLAAGTQVDPPAPFIGLHTLAVGTAHNLVDLKHLRLRPERMFRRFKPGRLLAKVTGRRPAPATAPTGSSEPGA